MKVGERLRLKKGPLKVRGELSELSELADKINLAESESSLDAEKVSPLALCSKVLTLKPVNRPEGDQNCFTGADSTTKKRISATQRGQHERTELMNTAFLKVPMIHRNSLEQVLLRPPGVELLVGIL